MFFDVNKEIYTYKQKQTEVNLKQVCSLFRFTFTLRSPYFSKVRDIAGNKNGLNLLHKQQDCWDSTNYLWVI